MYRWRTAANSEGAPKPDMSGIHWATPQTINIDPSFTMRLYHHYMDESEKGKIFYHIGWLTEERKLY